MEMMKYIKGSLIQRTADEKTQKWFQISLKFELKIVINNQFCDYRPKFLNKLMYFGIINCKEIYIGQERL